MNAPRDNQTRDAIVIVRTVGERTTDACLRIVRDQVPGRNVRVLTVRPFAQSVVQGLRTAARERPEWLFTLDADTLLIGDAVARLRRMCELVEPSVFHVKGLLLCRVYGGAQPRGFHAFRGSMLDEAMTHLDAVNDTTRPETAVVRRMEAAGHPSRFFAEVLGIHDYEQSLADLFLKLRSRAGRAGDVNRLRKRLEALSELHEDFLVSRWGLEDGMAHPEDSDRGALDRFDALCDAHGIGAKPALEPGDPGVDAGAAIEAYRPGAADYPHAHYAFSGDPFRWSLTGEATASPESPSRVSPWATAAPARRIAI
jgi:hypothetical protein